MICPQCKTRNPIGNKFCRECGAKIDAEGSLQAEESLRVEDERTRERVAALLAEAFALMEQGKFDLALPLAEEAADALPDSTSAHALLATLYERTEQEEKAIAAMERVVALNPNSQADREKLDQMRRGVHVLPTRVPERRQEKVPIWMPVALAGATVILVLAIGLSVLNRGTRTSRGSYRVATTDAAGPSSHVAPPVNAPAEAPAVALPGAGRDDPFISSSPASSNGQRTPRQAPRAGNLPTLPPPRDGSTAALPMPGRFRQPGTPPARRAGRQTAPVGPAAVRPGTDDSVTSAGVGATERIVVRPPSAEAPQQQPTRPSGYIRIQVGAPPRAAATPVETDPMLRAQSLQAAGRYADAITAYQQALRTAGGITRGDAYQGIALSQQRLGNREAARTAYRQAIAFYESAGGGAGQQGIAACRAALEVLGDG